MFRNITKTVWIISLVSLFNDFSSEMLYPVLPLYLAQIGYGSLLIGLVEGCAELVAGLTKIYTGSLSDSMQRRLPFVNLGYALSVLSRPLMVVSKAAGMVLLGRVTDKIGKGIRTAARDAILADESTAANRGEVFGFHRGMDTLGAILGPLLALAYLWYNPTDYRTIFFITLVPGCMAVLLTFAIREKKPAAPMKVSFSLRRHFSWLQTAPQDYRTMLAFALAFALVNSSDMFLLLRAKESGMSETEVLMMYVLFNAVFAIAAFPLGKLADRVNRRTMLVLGFLTYALCYFILAAYPFPLMVVVSFCLYGLYYACSQGLLKVLLLDRIPRGDTSSAIGVYEGLSSFVLLFANGIAGLLWYRFGAEVMLYLTAAGAVLVAVLLILKRNSSSPIINEV